MVFYHWTVANRPVISDTVRQRPVKSRSVVEGWALGLAQRIHSNILLTPPWIFIGAAKVRNLASFSTPVAFEALFFRNRATPGKS